MARLGPAELARLQSVHSNRSWRRQWRGWRLGRFEPWPRKLVVELPGAMGRSGWPAPRWSDPRVQSIPQSLPGWLRRASQLRGWQQFLTARVLLPAAGARHQKIVQARRPRGPVSVRWLVFEPGSSGPIAVRAGRPKRQAPAGMETAAGPTHTWRSHPVGERRRSTLSGGWQADRCWDREVLLANVSLMVAVDRSPLRPEPLLQPWSVG